MLDVHPHALQGLHGLVESLLHVLGEPLDALLGYRDGLQPPPLVPELGWTQDVGSFSSFPAMTWMYFLRSPALADMTPILSREFP